MDKKKNLESLKEEMVSDASLPLTGQANLVFGEGNLDCEVLFIGEAPGKNEDEQIRPFVGRGGQLLRGEIRAIGWKEEDVYITNIVKRRPPENRDPTPGEIEAYRPYLSRQIEIIKPRAIVPLGRFSMNYFLPEAKITRDQGRVFQLSSFIVIPMLHPAFALRGRTAMNAFKDTFRRLPGLLAEGARLGG